MTRSNTRRRIIAVGAATLATTLAATAVGGAAHAGKERDQRATPTTTVQPYLKPTAVGVNIKSHLTVDDLSADNGYELAGVPDGLGAFASKKNKAVVLMNHEFNDDEGIVRRHGEKGSFMSRLVIDQETGRVTHGRDLMDDIRYWDYSDRHYSSSPVAPAGATYGPTAAFSRFCSGSLTEPGQLLNESTQRGAHRQLYFANEENGPEGRVFAVRKSGKTTQLPRLGLLSWENTQAAANQTDTTVVMGNDDANPGQLRVYVGSKRPEGFPERRAGLTNGDLFVADTVNEAVGTDAEFRATYATGESARVQFGAGETIDTRKNGGAQNAEAAAKGLSLNRIEDGHFDPSNKDDYYFTTTEGGGTAPNPDEPGIERDGGGLWRLTFDNVERPELGGTLTLLLDGSEAPYLSNPDNITVDDEHNLLIQEDSGSSDHIARILAYNIKSGARGVLARFDPALFGVTNPSGTDPDDRARLTTNEESSGIIPTDELFGDDTYLFDAQVHTDKGLPGGTGPGTVEELVENGQLLSMQVDDWPGVYTIN